MKKEVIAWVMFLAGLANSCFAASPNAGEDEYRQALELNNKGRGKEALPLLSSLKIRYPAVLRYRFDYAAVASASGEHAQALAAVDESLEAQAPRYVLDALLRSSFVLKDVRRVERLYGRFVGRFGRDSGLEVKLCHLYLAAGQNDRALSFSEELARRQPRDLGVLDLRAYVLRQSARPGEALLVYQEIQRLFPDNREALKAIGMILADLGGTRRSASEFKRHGVRLALDESLRLDKDKGAQYVRWAQTDPDRPGERFYNANLAVATLVEARDKAVAGQSAPEMLVVIRSNLVMAYHARQDWSRAITEYEHLAAEKRVIPDEVKRVAASAYASMGRYEQAETLLRDQVAKNSDSFESTVAWIYALADLDRFDEAQKVCADLVARLAKRDLSNTWNASTYTSARLLQAMLFAYRGQYAEAQQRLEALQAAAPASLDATEALGVLAGWRGQPRKAEEQFRMVLGEQPQRVESRLALANVHWDRGEYLPLRLLVDELGVDYAAQRSVREAQGRMARHDGFYVVANASLGGDQYSVAGNRTREFDIKTYAPPFRENWQPFVRYRDFWSGPAVGTSAGNASAGLKYSARDWTSELEAGAYGYARLESSHVLSDQWSTGFALERNVFFRQARAVQQGVTANMASLNLRWRQDERFDIGGGYRITDFSNNRRSEAYVTANRSLYADYDWRLNAGARFSGQRNSNPGVTYFSPTRQLESSGTLSLEIRQWQDLTTKKSSWWHRFWVTAGSVHQSGYGAHMMSHYGYGQEIALSDNYRFRWSLSRTHYPFDGVKSSYYTGTLGFEGYF